MGAGAGEVPPWLTGRTRARSADHARVACAALGVPAAEVMAKYAVEAAEAGRAHVERFVLANFVATERAAKEGRNPRTGAAIQIAASRVPKFAAGKKLKEAVNT